MSEISPEDIKMQEIKELERELARRKSELKLDHPVEQADYVPGWTEAARESAKESYMEQERPLEPMASTVKGVAAGSLASVSDEQSAQIDAMAKSLETMDEESQIQTLSALAWQKGINYSIEVVRRMDNAYLLDRLHAVLSGELHDRLVDAKKLDDL